MRALLAAIRCPKGDVEQNLAARLVLFPAAPGRHGRRTDDASWQRGFDWWEGSALDGARRHARRRGLWVALPGQAGSTVDEDFPGPARRWPGRTAA